MLNQLSVFHGFKKKLMFGNYRAHLRISEVGKASKLPREFLQEVNPNMMKQFLQEEEGQTLVEYGLLISLIALVVIAVLTLLGGKIKGVFSTATNSIKTTT